MCRNFLPPAVLREKSEIGTDFSDDHLDPMPRGMIGANLFPGFGFAVRDDREGDQIAGAMGRSCKGIS